MRSNTFDKEDLSIAYMMALSVKISSSLDIDRRDYDSKDITIKKQINNYFAEIGGQLKSTNSKNVWSEDKTHISFKLKAKNYNDLTCESTTPKYLMLLILPEDENLWITCKIEELVLRKCMYWLDLSKAPKKNNTSSVTVKIPKENLLTPEALLKLLEKEAGL